MKHNEHDYEHFIESLGEQVMLVIWVSLLTLVSAGAIIALAINI